jgi:hypothetical protein
VKAKELYPQVFGRHALAYQQRIDWSSFQPCPAAS